MEKFLNAGEIIQMIAATVAFTALIIGTIMHIRQINDNKKHAKANLIMTCLEQYLAIMERKSRAISENDISLAFDVQRSIVDILWFEYKLWKKNLIDDDIFISWLELRRREYSNAKPDLSFSKEKNQNIFSDAKEYPTNFLEYCNRHTDDSKTKKK